MMKFLSGVLLICTISWYGVVAAAGSMTLNLKEADIRAVIATVSEMTGKNFIIDPRVKGKVTVLSSKPMDPDEVYQVFLSVLNIHGFAAIPGKNSIKIIPEADAKQSAILTVSGRGQSAGDEMITRIIPVENVSAAQLVPILRPLLPQQGHLAAYAQTNILIASGLADNMERIVDLVKRIDQANNTEIELVPLSHASAEEISRIITSINPSGSGKGAADLNDVKVFADPRTNSIILSGDKADRNRIKSIIQRLDTPAEGGGNTKVIYLRYANAAALVPVLGGAAKSANQAGNAGKPTAAAAINIQADESTNALVISASPDIIRELESIIRQLDIRRAQVMVKAIIAEISADKSAEFGVNWAGYSPNSSAPVGIIDLNGSLTATASKVAAGQPPSVVGTMLGFGRLTESSSGSTTGFVGLLQAIKGDADSNILATPTLVTLDNEEAEIVVGQNVPFVTGSYTPSSTTTSNPFQTIQREDVGLTLRIKPQINEGDSIRMNIVQEVSSVNQSAESASDLITNKRSLKTTVMVDDGQVLALGGLLDETMSESDHKVPGLGDIPLLGWLFSYKKSAKVKRDLTMFLHPLIIRDSRQGTEIASRKYNLLRAQQIKSNEEQLGLINGEAPIVPPLSEFLELPPPYVSEDGEPVLN
jgi:general secretion pathway protein D